jgi:hypothetical protein
MFLLMFNFITALEFKISKMLVTPVRAYVGTNLFLWGKNEGNFENIEQ